MRKGLPWMGLLPAILLIQCGESRSARYRQAVLPDGIAGPAPIIRGDFALTIDTQRIRFTKAYFQKHNQRLFQSMPKSGGMEAIRFEPRILVVHYTAIPTLEETVAYFAPNRIHSDRGIVTDSGALNVGIQYIVDWDGTIYRSYPDNVMSRHVIGLNHVAIGIENVGNADLGAEPTPETVPLTQAQLDANVALIRHLAGKYPEIRFVIGHMEYRDLEDPDHPAHHLFEEDDPQYRTDKIDPGKNFMARLRKRLKDPSGT